MRSILLSAVLILVASANLHATEALIFDGGGHNLYILIGQADKPAVAQVRYTPPGANEWVSVPREMIEVKKLDLKKQVLLMEFTNKNQPGWPASFSLSVKKKNAVLTIDGKKITSSFDWADE